MLDLVYVKNKRNAFPVDLFKNKKIKPEHEHLTVEFNETQTSRITENVPNAESYVKHAPIVAFQYLAQTVDKPITSWVNYIVERYNSEHVVLDYIANTTKKENPSNYERYICEIYMILTKSSERMFFDTLKQNKKYIYFLIQLMLVDLTENQIERHKPIQNETINKKLRQDFMRKFDFVRGLTQHMNQNKQKNKNSYKLASNFVVSTEGNRILWDMHRICFTDLNRNKYQQRMKNKKYQAKYIFEHMQTEPSALGLLIVILNATMGEKDEYIVELAFTKPSSALQIYKFTYENELSNTDFGSDNDRMLNAEGYNDWYKQKFETYNKINTDFANLYVKAKDRPIYMRPVGVHSENENTKINDDDVSVEEFETVDLKKEQKIPVTLTQLLRSIEDDALRTNNIETFYLVNQIWSLCNQLRVYQFNRSQLEATQLTNDLDVPIHLLDLTSLTLMAQTINDSKYSKHNFTFDDIIKYRENAENNQLQNVIYALFTLYTQILNALKHTHKEAISMHTLRTDYEQKIEKITNVNDVNLETIDSLEQQLKHERQKKDANHEVDIKRIKALEKQIAPFERTKERLDERTNELNEANARIAQLEKAYNDILNEQPDTTPAVIDMQTPQGNSYGLKARTDLIERLNDERTLLIGGFPTWSSRLQTLIPKAHYISADSLSRNVEAHISKAKYIIFNTHVVNHSLYERVKSATSSKSVFCHFNAKTNDPENTLIYIYDELIHLRVI